MSGVLVTGATTPLGARIVELLAARPDVDRVLAVGIEPEREAPAALKRGAVSYLQVDLTRSRNVRNLMFGPVFEHDVHTLVHTAQHRSARDEGSRVHKLNVKATRNLLYLAEQHPSIHRFVFRSSGVVYRIEASTPTLLREDRELDLSPQAPQWIRDRVEADLAVCARMAGELDVVVLRCAEILAPGTGSQLLDYLSSRVCFRPLGFDPMLNLLTVEDAADAFLAGLDCEATGVFNIPGADTLPLSKVIAKWGRTEIPAPGPLLGPLYRWRSRVRGTDFLWRLNRNRFHTANLLDGARAERLLGYRPSHRIDWPFPEAGPPTRV